MLSRSSHVKNIKLIIVGLSSNLQIGDINHVDGLFEALAVQHTSKVIIDDPEHFSSYSMFSEPIAIPIIYENMTFTKFDKKPTINVDHIQVNAVSSASVMAIGNISHTRMTSKLLNIRRLSEWENTDYSPNTEGG
ncbi:spore germination protein GerPE [Bacillus sp. JJ722]|uniref:spore germination protein GerPE n=1 Tax=Bacillus sp. JJ722 TaxID=3122973 RepID=UPI002FFEF36C